MKNDKSLLELIDYLTVGLVQVLKKIGKLVNNKNSHDIVFIFTKIIVTFILIALLNIPFTILKELGISLIYYSGGSLRYLLSIGWIIIVYLSYFIVGFTVFLKVFNSILKDKELNLIEENRRKDSHAKKKVFLPIIKVIKACMIILTIPIIVVLAAILIFLGMNVCLFVNGYNLFFLLFVLVGLFIMVLAAVLMIFDIASGGNK